MSVIALQKQLVASIAVTVTFWSLVEIASFSQETTSDVERLPLETPLARNAILSTTTGWLTFLIPRELSARSTSERQLCS
jgi:hypothetical protein